jgi:hypothetical protein
MRGNAALLALACLAWLCVLLGSPRGWASAAAGHSNTLKHATEHGTPNHSLSAPCWAPASGRVPQGAVHRPSANMMFLRPRATLPPHTTGNLITFGMRHKAGVLAAAAYERAAPAPPRPQLQLRFPQLGKGQEADLNPALGARTHNQQPYCTGYSVGTDPAVVKDVAVTVALGNEKQEALLQEVQRQLPLLLSGTGISAEMTVTAGKVVTKHGIRSMKVHIQLSCPEATALVLHQRNTLKLQGFKDGSVTEGNGGLRVHVPNPG